MTENLVRGIVSAGFAVALALPTAADAQVFGEPEETPVAWGVSVDVTNRYVWRGLEVSDEANLQPGGWLAWGPLEVGTWGSYAIDGDFREQDFWVTYYLPESNLGSFALTVNDYYIAEDFGEGLFDFDGTRVCEEDEEPFGDPGRCAGGPHTAEVMLSFVHAALPIDAAIAYNFHNDPENALYGEVGLRPSFAGFDFGFVAGGVFGESAYYYGTDGAALTNLTAGVSRSVPGLPFDLPLAVEVVHNPHFEETYYVARAGISIER